MRQCPFVIFLFLFVAVCLTFANNKLFIQMDAQAQGPHRTVPSWPVWPSIHDSIRRSPNIQVREQKAKDIYEWMGALSLSRRHLGQ